MNEKMNDIVEELCKNENKGAIDLNVTNSRKKFEDLASQVENVIVNNPGLSCEKIKHIIFKSSTLDSVIRKFVFDSSITPGLVLTCGTPTFSSTFVSGNASEISCDFKKNIKKNIVPCNLDTIYDIASVTKFFTGLCVLKLSEVGMIDLNADVTDYCSEFTNLKGVTVLDLLTFNKSLKTDKRIDECDYGLEARRVLFDMHPLTEELKNPYTDLGAMVLKYVIESVSGMKYDDFLRINILEPLGMNNTFSSVPSELYGRLASTNLTYRINKDNGDVNVDSDYYLGVPRDPKARILRSLDGLCGHAGLFTTNEDLSILCGAVVAGDVISPESLRVMSTNVTGRKNDDGTYRKFLGGMSYVKHPDPISSEIYHPLSSESVAMEGWTGSQITMDPVNKVWVALTSNRCHNRLVDVPSEYSKDSVYSTRICSKDGKTGLLLPNNRLAVDSSRFAWDKDKLVHDACDLALMYRIADMYFGDEKEQAFCKTFKFIRN